MEDVRSNGKDYSKSEQFGDLQTISEPPFDYDGQESRVRAMIGDLKTYLHQPDKEVDVIGSESLLAQLREDGVLGERDLLGNNFGSPPVLKAGNECDLCASVPLESSPEKSKVGDNGTGKTNPFFTDNDNCDNPVTHDSASKSNPFLVNGDKVSEMPMNDVSTAAATIGLQPLGVCVPEIRVTSSSQTQTESELSEKDEFPRPSQLFPPKRSGYKRPSLPKNYVDAACGSDVAVPRRPPPPPIPAVRPAVDIPSLSPAMTPTSEIPKTTNLQEGEVVDSRDRTRNFQIKQTPKLPSSSPSSSKTPEEISKKRQQNRNEYPLLLTSGDVARHQTEALQVEQKSFNGIPEFSSEPYDKLDVYNLKSGLNQANNFDVIDVIPSYDARCAMGDTSSSVRDEGPRNTNDFRRLETLTDEDLTQYDARVRTVKFAERSRPTFGEVLVGVPFLEDWEHGASGRASIYSVTSDLGDRSVGETAFLDESMMRPDVTDVESLQGEGGEVESRLRINHFLVPVLTLEILILTCLAILAFYLRFTDEFPVFERAIFCDDKSLRYPYYSAYATFEVRPKVLYSVCFLLPPILIVVGEVGYWLFSTKPRKVVRAHCTTCKITLTYRRLLRFIGAFLLGALCTSILTDAIKLMAGRPRPYFLIVCDPLSTLCSPNSPIAVLNGTSACAFGDFQLVRQARLSFPSFYAALSSYSAVYTMIYLHNILRMHGTYALRPLLVLLIGGLSLLAGFSRLMAYRNHWQDVLAGFILGSGIAAYFGILLMNRFQEHSPKRRPDMYLTQPEEGSKFFRWFWIPRITFGKNSQRGYGGMYSNGPNDKGPLGPNPAFQQDLHRRIENFGKKNQKQPKHPKQPPPQPPLASQSPKVQTPDDRDGETMEQPEITTMQAEEHERNSD